MHDLAGAACARQKNDGTVAPTRRANRPRWRHPRARLALLRRAATRYNWVPEDVRDFFENGTAMNDSMTHVSTGDYRIIRRCGAVVAFNPAKLSRALTKAFLAVTATPARASTPCLSLVSDDTAGDTSGGAAPGESGGANGDDDDDGGDGDGDGPRRPSQQLRRVQRQTSQSPRPLDRFRAARRRTIPSYDPDAPHRRSLIALVLLTVLILAAAVGFAHAGHSWLAAEAMAMMAGGIPLLAKRLVKPK